MLHSWISLIPPLIVIISAALIKHIHPALFLGIVSAALVTTHGSMHDTALLTKDAFLGTLYDIDQMLLYAFLIAIGILVSLFTTTGSALSFCQTMIHKIKSARSAQYASMMVSSLLFIDDYLSILTTGYIMRPLLDEFKVSRYKLAFLVHSLAGPIVILAPLSSWVATIIAYIQKAGVDTDIDQATRILADPFYIYLRSIPFIFYSFFMIFSVWFIIRNNISFGPMQEHENDQPALTPRAHTGTTSVLDLLAPLATLIGGVIIGLPLAGGFWLFGGTHGLIESLKYNEHPFLVMLIAAILAIIVSMSIALYRKTFTLSQFPKICIDGFNLMYSPIGMVFLATTLSGLLANHVGTGQYLAAIMINSVSIALIPVLFFLVSLIATIATGSAWGNFAIMIPIAIPMITTLSSMPMPIDPYMLPLLFPVLGAIFSGSVCGDHISPMSETTMMTATSTNTNVFTHAYTQFFYALPAVCATMLAYLMSGYMADMHAALNVGICLVIGVGVIAAMLTHANKQQY